MIVQTIAQGLPTPGAQAAPSVLGAPSAPASSPAPGELNNARNDANTNSEPAASNARTAGAARKENASARKKEPNDFPPAPTEVVIAARDDDERKRCILAPASLWLQKDQTFEAKLGDMVLMRDAKTRYLFTGVYKQEFPGFDGKKLSVLLYSQKSKTFMEHDLKLRYTPLQRIDSDPTTDGLRERLQHYVNEQITKTRNDNKRAAKTNDKTKRQRTPVRSPAVQMMSAEQDFKKLRKKYDQRKQEYTSLLNDYVALKDEYNILVGEMKGLKDMINGSRRIMESSVKRFENGDGTCQCHVQRE